MAAPSNGVLYAAAEKWVASPLFEEITGYLGRVLYRFADVGQAIAKTHVIYLQVGTASLCRYSFCGSEKATYPILCLEFDQERSERNSRREQFKLVEGGVVTFQKLAEIFYCNGSPGENAKDRRAFVAKLSNPKAIMTNAPPDHDLATIVVLANAKKLQASSIPQMLIARSWYKCGGMSMPIGHTTGWLDFTKKAFSEGPIPHDWTEVRNGSMMPGEENSGSCQSSRGSSWSRMRREVGHGNDDEVQLTGSSIILRRNEKEMRTSSPRYLKTPLRSWCALLILRASSSPHCLPSRACPRDRDARATELPSPSRNLSLPADPFLTSIRTHFTITQKQPATVEQAQADGVALSLRISLFSLSQARRRRLEGMNPESPPPPLRRSRQTSAGETHRCYERGRPTHPSPLNRTSSTGHYNTQVLNRIVDHIARDMIHWEEGGVEGQNARRGKLIVNVSKTIATVLNLVIAAVSGADFQTSVSFSPAIPLALSVVAACMTLVPNVCPPANDDTIKLNERICEAQLQAFYHSEELLESVEIASDADEPRGFPLPNPYNIELPDYDSLPVQVNALFRKIKDECHRASGKDPDQIHSRPSSPGANESRQYGNRISFDGADIEGAHFPFGSGYGRGGYGTV
ncbi:hypothetical protein P7C70_g3713, partial [Phenoliferia sp. Uapishka_3]